MTNRHALARIKQRNDAPGFSGGFTLVEVLVAMSVSAIVAVLAYQSLAAASDAAERSQKVAAQLDSIDRVWQFIERDLRQALPRPKRVGSGSEQSVDYPSFSGEGADAETQYAAQGFVLRFRRGGWLNPLEQMRSHLQGVGYRLLDGNLYRFHWPIRNSSELEEDLILAIEEHQQPLLEGVEAVGLRFLPPSAKTLADDSWKQGWPPGERDADSLPMALEMTLTVKGFGESTRLFNIAAGL